MRAAILAAVQSLWLYAATAQPLTLNDVVWTSNANQPCSAQALPTGIAYRWKASDLSSSPVSIWTDEIQGFNWTSIGTARPSWDANGVAFDGIDDTLSSTNFSNPVGGNNWLVVLKFNSVTAPKMVMCHDNSGGQIFVGIGNSGQLYEAASPGGLGPNPIGTAKFDLLICKTTNSPNAYVAYTNGVSGWSALGPFNDNTSIQHVGSGAGDAFFNGTLNEVIVWTNSTFTACQVAAIHGYATNTYAITP